MNSKQQCIESDSHEISRYTGRNHSTGENPRLVKEDVRKEITINQLFGSEFNDTNLLNILNGDLLGIDKHRFLHDTRCEITAVEVNHIKNQNLLLKQLITELKNENQLLKKRLISHERIVIAKE